MNNVTFTESVSLHELYEYPRIVEEETTYKRVIKRLREVYSHACGMTSTPCLVMEALEWSCPQPLLGKTNSLTL